MTTRTLIVGAGAIGGVTAARLARAGQDVTVLDANVEHVGLMNDPGLVFDELGETSVIPITAVSDASELVGHFDFALIIVKAPFLESAITPLLERNLIDTYVSCGNGLVQDRMEEFVGGSRLLIGIVEWGATNLGPGHVAQTTIAPFVIGEVDGTITPRLEQLRDVLHNVGDVRISEYIFGQVWSKLLLNSTFSGLGVVSGLVYADVLAQPGGQDLAFGLWREGYDVAIAAGIELDDMAGVHPDRLVVRTAADRPSAEIALAELMARLGPTKASMLQDVERGARTEVDVINGGVVAHAQRLGLTAALNERIVEMVHECEQGLRRPQVANLTELNETKY